MYVVAEGEETEIEKGAAFFFYKGSCQRPPSSLTERVSGGDIGETSAFELRVDHS